MKGKFFIVAILTAILLSFIYAAVLMWLWNAIIVGLFTAPILTYWQAYGICIISNILLKPHLTRGYNDKN